MFVQISRRALVPARAARHTRTLIEVMCAALRFRVPHNVYVHVLKRGTLWAAFGHTDAPDETRRLEAREVESGQKC